MILSFILDMVYVTCSLVVQDACTALPTVLERHGSAFACGFTRVVFLLFVALITAIEAYFIFAVWSLMEDFKSGGSESGFQELYDGGGKETLKKRNANYRDARYGAA